MKKIQSRRTFLRNSLGAAAAFTIVPRHVLGRGYLAPSDQLTKGVIGTGYAGKQHFTHTGIRVIAICDVDSSHLQEAKEMLNSGGRLFDDYRELIRLPEVDIVHIATPPHWHGIMAEEAARAGKDIWCETPMTRTIGEGKRVQEAVQQYGRIFRLNTNTRFENSTVKKLVNSGFLGWPLTVTLGSQTGFDWNFNWTGKTNLPVVPIPPGLNYDRWLGPAPYKPYHPHRVHQTFRGYWDYDGGALGDKGQQYLDAVQYFLGKDHTSPVSVEIDAPQQHPDAVGTWKRITFTYKDGCRIILDGEGKDDKAAFIEGPAGKLYPGFRSTIPALEKRLASYPEPQPQVTDFTEAVRQRKKFGVNEENGHRSCTLVNMGKIALQMGRSLEFDPEKQLFLYDDGANRLIDPPIRGSYI